MEWTPGERLCLHFGVLGPAPLTAVVDRQALMSRLATLIMTAALVLLSGCASKGLHTQQTTPPTTQQPLLLAPGVMLRLVSTSINDPLDHSEALIDPEGNVSLALHVKVHVAGLTLPEAAAVIQKAYQPSYFKDWNYTVVRVPLAQLQPVPRGLAPPFIFTKGEFKGPGRYPWTNGMSLKEGVDAAGGFTDSATRRLQLKHWDGSQEFYRLGPGRTLTNNPALKAGDSIISPIPPLL